MFHANTRAKMRFVILLFALLTLFLAGCSADGAAFTSPLTAVESPLPVPDEWSAAVDDDQTLGGRITMGLARISSGQSGFVIISNTKYRCLDFFSTVPTKAPFQSGI